MAPIFGWKEPNRFFCEMMERRPYHADRMRKPKPRRQKDPFATHMETSIPRAIRLPYPSAEHIEFKPDLVVEGAGDLVKKALAGEKISFSPEE